MQLFKGYANEYGHVTIWESKGRYYVKMYCEAADMAAFEEYGYRGPAMSQYQFYCYWLDKVKEDMKQ